MRTELEAWFQERTGAYLLRQERAVLAETLPTIFGYYMVQTGAWGPEDALLETSPIRTRLLLGPDMTSAAQVRGHPAWLPFANDSVDALLLPHTLEHLDEPQQALREAERVLTGEGHLIVLGFHPWGAWGLRQQFGNTPPWAGRCMRVARLQEWLTVLGFETLRVRHYLFRPPFKHYLLVRSAFLDRLHWRATAGAYMLVARKRVFAMTPLRRKRIQPSRAFADMAKPTARGLP